MSSGVGLGLPLVTPHHGEVDTIIKNKCSDFILFYFNLSVM